MTLLTLLEKAYGLYLPRSFETELESLCQGLKVRIEVRGRTAHGWIQVELQGDDEPVARQVLDDEIGIALVSVDRVSKFMNVRGKIFSSKESTGELQVDIGVFTPSVRSVIIPLSTLSAQLMDGKNVTLQHTTELYCLHDHVPMQIKILNGLNSAKGAWSAELSEAQLSLFSNWLMTNLDRLIVLGASRTDVDMAIERAGHSRDIVKIETLGPLEHALECKLGTDAVGLMPRLGRRLRKASLMPFNPRKIKKELGW